MPLDSLFISVLSSHIPSALLTFPLVSDLQVRPTQRTTATRRSANRALSVPAWCGWRLPAPTPTTPNASASTTSTSTASLDDASRALCARWDRAFTRTATLTTIPYVRSVWTRRFLTGRATWNPVYPAPSARKTSRLSWLSARPPVTPSATVSLLLEFLTPSYSHTNIDQSFMHVWHAVASVFEFVSFRSDLILNFWGQRDVMAVQKTGLVFELVIFRKGP